MRTSGHRWLSRGHRGAGGAGASPWAGAVAWLVCLLCLARPHSADAQVPGDGVVARGRELGRPPPTPAPRLAWQRGPARWFLATKTDTGVLYLRPRLSGGYGKPHQRWVGFDANPLVSSAATGFYAGVRLEHPVASLRSGLLYAFSFRRSRLPIQDHYDRRDVELMIEGQNARYASWDSELELHVPAGPVTLLSESQPVVVGEVPDNRYLFLESVRVVMAPHWVLRQRLGVAFPWPWIEGFSFALVGEGVYVPNRDDTVIWRAGATVRWWLYPDLEMRINFVPVVHSPDRLGIIGGDFAQFGVRWLWATR